MLATRRASVISARVAIDAIAAGGDGVGRLEGLAVFIPRSAPGDVVNASLIKHKRFARGRIEHLAQSSALRVTPLCPHYDGDDCGGCQLQHLALTAQRDVKSRIVRDTLSRIGKREVALPPVEPSPESWDYRQKLTLTLLRNSESREWVGGLHPLDQPARVFALEQCRISAPPLVAMWHSVRHVAGLLPSASTLRLTFRSVPDTRGVALTVDGGTEWNNWSLLAKELPDLAALWWVSSDGVRQELIAPTPAAATTAAGFIQVNASLAPAMHNWVLKQVNSFAPRRAIDAYAGTGALSLALAATGVHVTAIEWDHSAVALLQRTLPTGSVSIASSVEAVINDVLNAAERFDVVVVNPPRVGLEARVTQSLNEQCNTGLRGIVYVSCDPATLARDLARLPAWRIQSLQCFDMFPQTAHVETVCVLVPENS